MKHSASHVVLCALGAASPCMAQATVFSAAGADAASITSSVNAFRSALGDPNNGAGGGPFLNGRREINWDAPALDAFASPALMPADFFNRAAGPAGPGSPRGAVFSTPGDGLLVSRRNGADASDPTLRFGDIDPSYAANFRVFSAQRLFAASNSTIIDTHFRVPSDPSQPAFVRGFGAVFTDVDSDASSFIEFFSTAGQLVHIAHAAPADNGLSFVGVHFDESVQIGRVRIHAGTHAMSPGLLDGGSTDIVALDDFFYSEPQAIPGPASLALLCIGAGVAQRRKR